ESSNSKSCTVCKAFICSGYQLDNRPRRTTSTDTTRCLPRSSARRADRYRRGIDLAEGSAEVVSLQVGGGEDLLSGADSSAETRACRPRGGPKGPQRQVCQPEEGPNRKRHTGRLDVGERRTHPIERRGRHRARLRHQIPGVPPLEPP